MSGARQAPRENDSFGRPLPAEAIRVSDLMPARDKSVILFIADADVAIHGLPVVGWNSGTNDEPIWWTGVPGNYIALIEHRWSITHWAPLHLRQEPAVNAELLADKKDAQRYRHLRDSKTLDQWIWDALDHAEGDAYSKGLDDAIDAAIAKAVQS